MRRGRKKVQNPATARRILAAAERHFAAQGLLGESAQVTTFAKALVFPDGKSPGSTRISAVITHNSSIYVA